MTPASNERSEEFSVSVNSPRHFRAGGLSIHGWWQESLADEVGDFVPLPSLMVIQHASDLFFHRVEFGVHRQRALSTVLDHSHVTSFDDFANPLSLLVAEIESFSQFVDNILCENGCVLTVRLQL